MHAYTLMLKSIKDNRSTNFQKQTDNLSFKMLKFRVIPFPTGINQVLLYGYLETIFGYAFVTKVEKYNLTLKD